MSLPRTPSAGRAANDTPRLRVDLHCRVVDHFGDAGVCWRLATELARCHGAQVRLWIDDTALIDRLRDPADPPIEILAWRDDCPVPSRAERPDAIVAAFAARLPPAWLDAFAGDPQAPVLVNLEYLSPEAWVAGVHGQASHDPSRDLLEWFFCPGFDEATGGLPREPDLPAGGTPPAAGDPAAFRARWAPPGAGPLVSVFCYDTAPLERWLRLLAAGPRPVRLLIAEPVGHPALAALCGRLPGTDEAVQVGALGLRRLPFLTQRAFDAVLWSCDLNFVRGEDSWIRSLWAPAPAVWQPYVQSDGADRIKRDAFLERWCAARPGLAPLASFTRAWGDADPGLAPAWEALLDALAPARCAWADAAAEAARVTGMGTRLTAFLRGRLQSRILHRSLSSEDSRDEDRPGTAHRQRDHDR